MSSIIRRSLSFLPASLLAASVLVGGCALDASDPQGSSDLTAGSNPAVSASLPGFTVSTDLYVHPDSRSGKDVWVVHSRTSKSLTAALAFDDDGDIGTTTVVSPRVFEVAFDADAMESLIEETRLFVRLSVAGTSAPYFATMTFEPRLRRFTGSSKIYALEEFRPVLVGSDVLFRGTVGLGTGVTNLAVDGPLGPCDALTKDSAKEYEFDFAPNRLLDAARAPSATLAFTATSAGATVEKDGALTIDVAELEVIQGNPAVAFPDPPCDDAVEACLAALPAGQKDTGTCGTAKEVRTCRTSFGD